MLHGPWQLVCQSRCRVRPDMITESRGGTQLHPCAVRLAQDGGWCADISDAVHAWNNDTQLQLTWRSIIVDRYNLDAADIAALRRDVAHIKNDRGGAAYSAPPATAAVSKKKTGP